MIKVAGAFLCIEDDVVIGETVLLDWKDINIRNQFDKQIIFLKGTRDVVNGLVHKQSFSDLIGEKIVLWIKNRKITKNDAAFLTLLLNIESESPRNTYFLYTENFDNEELKSENFMGWNARCAFDGRVRDNLKLGFFVDFESLVLEYQLSDWLAVSIRNAVNRFARFFNEICSMLSFVEKSWNERKVDGPKVKIVFRDLKVQAKKLNSEWSSLRSDYPCVYSPSIHEFVSYTSGSLSRLDAYNSLDSFFMWKSVIFGAKARLLLDASEFDYAYFWCFRALEEYLKSCIFKLGEADFYGDSCKWNSSSVQGVTKLLKIFQNKLSDSELLSKAEDLYYYVKLRNISIIGHGTIKHSKKETSEFVYKVSGFIVSVDRNSLMRNRWLDQVKYVESFYKGEVYNVFLKILYEEAEISQIFK